MRPVITPHAIYPNMTNMQGQAPPFQHHTSLLTEKQKAVAEGEVPRLYDVFI